MSLNKNYVKLIKSISMSLSNSFNDPELLLAITKAQKANINYLRTCMNSVFDDSTMLSTLEKARQCALALTKSSLSSFLTDPDVLSRAMETQQYLMKSAFNDILTPDLMRKIGKAHINSLKLITSSLNNLTFNDDGTIIFNGNTYNTDLLINEADICIEKLNKNKKQLTTKEIFKAFWAIFITLTILYTLPKDIIESTTFNRELILEYISPLLISHQLKVFVFNENGANLYQEPNTASDILHKIPYSDCMIVIDSINYWYEVEYIDNDDNIYRGWIAKVNVEIITGY